MLWPRRLPTRNNNFVAISLPQGVVSIGLLVFGICSQAEEEEMAEAEEAMADICAEASTSPTDKLGEIYDRYFRDDLINGINKMMEMKLFTAERRCSRSAIASPSTSSMPTVTNA